MNTIGAKPSALWEYILKAEIFTVNYYTVAEYNYNQE
jgi:hypothetical protein